MTRITIVTDTDTIPLRDDYRWKHHIHAIKKNGITGLFGTPGMKESTTSIPQQDGDYWPSRITQKPRSISLDCVIRGLSSAEDRTRETRTAINALFRAKPLTHHRGNRRRNTPTHRHARRRPRTHHAMEGTGFEFGLVITCPDPLKYGQPVTYTTSGGVIRCQNPGTGGHVAEREDIGACDLADVVVCRASRAMAGRCAESGIGFPGHDTQRGHCHL